MGLSRWAGKFCWGFMLKKELAWKRGNKVAHGRVQKGSVFETMIKVFAVAWLILLKSPLHRYGLVKSPVGGWCWLFNSICEANTLLRRLSRRAEDPDKIRKDSDGISTKLGEEISHPRKKRWRNFQNVRRFTDLNQCNFGFILHHLIKKTFPL